MSIQSFDSYDEKQLADLLRDGNVYVYELIFRRYYKSLCGFAVRFIQQPEDAEEIVQDVFLKLWEKKNTLLITTSLKSYLFRSTYNSCMNALSHAKIENRYAAFIRDYLLRNPYSFNPVMDSLVYKDMNNKITAAIEQLPEACREIFKMSRFDGLKYAEIASKLNISVKTVETQISRALAKLREELKEFFVNE